jgi:polyisoprenoid-binding protein YceI
MKKITIFIISIFINTLALAQYKPAEQGSNMQFTVQNLGFDVHGSFSGFKGIINFDAQNPTVGNFDVTIDAATVNTDNTMRDGHLKDDTYFDVKNYPTIHFASNKITAASKAGAYNITGKLTIKNKSADITFPFTATPSGDGYLLKGSFKINRKDYGVGGTSTISNQVEISLNVLAKKG